MKDIISKIDENLIIFLDGHVTDNKSGFTSGGIKDCPLLEELETITNNFNKKCIIIVDDARLLGHKKGKETANCDWADITYENILNKLDSKRLDKIYFEDGEKSKNDRIIIIYNSK